MGDRAEFEGEPADADGGRALGLADEIGDRDLLGAEAFGDADGPFAADYGSGGRGLGEDVACGDGQGVEAVLDVHAQAAGVGLFCGFGDGEAGQIWHFDLAAMDGDAHGKVGGEERYREYGEGAEEDVEEALHWDWGKDTGKGTTDSRG